MNANFPSTDLRSLAGVYNDYAYANVLKWNKQKHILFVEHTFAYLDKSNKSDESKKEIIINEYIPKHNNEAVAFLWYEIKDLIDLIICRWMQWTCFKFNGTIDEYYYNLYDVYLNKQIHAISKKLNDGHNYNIKTAPNVNNMLELYDLCVHLKNVFDKGITADFNVQWTLDSKNLIANICINPYWKSENDTYTKIMHKHYTITDEIENVVILKNPDAVQLKL